MACEVIPKTDMHEFGMMLKLWGVDGIDEPK
jgi:hypothetical protein